MKKLIFSFFLCCPLLICQLFGQMECVQETHKTMSVNQVHADIGNTGGFFSQINAIDDGFSGIYNDSLQNIAQMVYAANLWLGGLDSSGAISTSISINSSLFNPDFSPGPIVNGQAQCTNWNRIWSVKRAAIQALSDDFNDNGIIDFPIDSTLLQWPAKGNPHFQSTMGFPLPLQDLAPFFDNNSDGIYNPYDGDIPIFEEGCNAMASEIFWTVFNDIGLPHMLTLNALGVEVQLTAFAFDATEEYAKRTVFLKHKIIKKTGPDLHGVRMGIWMDYDMGCGIDLIGSSPAHNCFYAYNSTNNDNCGTDGFGVNSPVHITGFLDQNLASYIHYYNGNNPGDPTGATDYYNLLKGLFPQGHPITNSGNGYNTAGNIVNHSFPDPPSDTSGWSMYTAQLSGIDTRIVGAADIDSLSIGQSFELTSASAIVRNLSLNHIQQVDYALDMMDSLNMLRQNCYALRLTNNNYINTSEPFDVTVYPNPTDGIVYVEMGEKISDYVVEVFDATGRKLKELVLKNQKKTDLNLRDFPKGIYFMKIASKNGKAEMRRVVLF